MKDLETCRKEIDELDQQIIELFEKRMSVGKDVVTYKLANHLEIFQAGREKQVIAKNVERVSQEVLKPYVKTFIQDMMNLSKSYQATFVPVAQKFDLYPSKKENMTVGYQGVPGSFSENALESFFGNETSRKNYENFEDVFKALEHGEVDYGVVPLENSSTGAINDNYDFIRDYDFYIVGEQSLSISQHLLGIKGSSVEGMKEVYSHPQGLLQTSLYLSQYPNIQKKEYLNTATAAKYVSEQNNPTIGAIASKKAAEIYGLDILEEDIQNIKTNSTRFIIFSKHLERIDDASCVSIVFTLNHQPGALYEVMKIIKGQNINMLRIESRPLKKTPWEYYFYVDFEGNLEQSNIIMALEDMKAHTNTLRVLGSYVKK